MNGESIHLNFKLATYLVYHLMENLIKGKLIRVTASLNNDGKVDTAHLIKRHDDCSLIATSIRGVHC